MSSRTELSKIKQTTIKEQLKVLTSVIQKTNNDVNNLGLVNGLTGELLFLWQASCYDKTLVNEEIFYEKFEFLQENFSVAATNFSLENGLAGAGWFLEYINQAQGEDYDPELCDDIDNILLNTISVTSWRGEIEMLQGLAGLSIYGARRLLKTEQDDFYEKFINHFEKLATQIDKITLSWQQPSYSVYRLNEEDISAPEYNLGLAHGIVGIIAAILPALNIPSLYLRTKKLLVQSCDWLLQQELVGADKKSFFPSSMNDNHYSRLGWCYGDLTIALTLARVGKVLEFPSYIEKAKEISLHASQREEYSAMVQDAGICHGSSGIALIFQLLHKELQLEELIPVVNNWLNVTLELYSDKGLKGYYKYSGFEKDHIESLGLLTGYSGIGLCFLALLTGDSEWTDCLLLS